VEILLVAGYTALFLFFIHRWKFFRPGDVPLKWVKLLFILKVAAGCFLGLLYTYYYTDRTTADTFKFFDDSKVLFNALFTAPREFFSIFFNVHSDTKECFEICAQMNAWNNQDVLFNDNKTLVRLNVLFHFFSLGKYYVHVVFLNFLSFTGLIALFRLFSGYTNGKSKLLFIFMMFLPSVLFWGSGLLKDGLLLFALGLLLYTFNNLVTSAYSARSVTAFFLCLVLLMFTKLYVLFIIIPALCAWYWSRADKGKKVVAKFIACYALYFFAGLNVGNVSDKYDVVDLVYYKQKNFNVLARVTQAKSVIDIPQIAPTAWSLIVHAPSAVLRVLVRPTPFDSASPLVFMAALENIFIILTGIFSLVFSRMKINGAMHLFCFSIFFVICMYALIGLITPILGAMVRYKVPALLFLVFIFVTLADGSRLKSKFPALQKLL
jgi:hypothetical protein